MPVFGELSKHTLFRMIVFIVLVWLAVDIGIMLPRLVPNMPGVLKKVMDPSTGNANTTEQAHL